ncbi:HTH-type transcriptional regulator CdhR [Ascidiaceihabitans donghaensis]|uniref:HTH-type transcriptional regulator CdhR n=1 Tax=Ascidiaceihabitans donghaensis TaxID=1510460 RepID=A0A2R8BIT4_9RHOB|nr:helix-turn-helix domain-containing protein [Ascidiaceihabitans donghaensis]SPH22942.1 HTH-type transcriptional regulator CdhR [Ascidiaceihabitans donghaensis]
MTKPAPIVTKATPWCVDIILAEGFVLVELSGVVEVLRMANRINPGALFTWRFLSRHGGYVASRSGLGTQTEAITHRSEAEYLFVIGNSNADAPELSLGPIIAAYTYRKAKVVLMSEAASRYISEHPTGSAAHTTHWENRAVLHERGDPSGEGTYALAVDDGRIVTCAGMGAAVDLTLSLVGNHMSAAGVMTVADILLHEKIRDFKTLQPFGGKRLTITGDRELDQCIELMQAHMEEPLPIAELVARVGLSSRSLERRFHRRLNTTPNTYYRELRLNWANNLLLNTTMTIREIGLACGFPNGFSSLYRSFFGVTPTAIRQKKQAAGHVR